MDCVLFEEPYLRITRLDARRAVITMCPPRGTVTHPYVTCAVADNRTVLGPRRDSHKDEAQGTHDAYTGQLARWDGLRDWDLVRGVLAALEQGVLEAASTGLQVTEKATHAWQRLVPVG